MPRERERTAALARAQQEVIEAAERWADSVAGLRMDDSADVLLNEAVNKLREARKP